MWHPEHPESSLPNEIDLDKEEQRAFPYGKLGDVRYDPLLDGLVIIQECEIKQHEETAGHEHVYTPSVVGHFQWSGPYKTRKITNPQRLITIEDYSAKLKAAYEKEANK